MIIDDSGDILPDLNGIGYTLALARKQLETGTVIKSSHIIDDGNKFVTSASILNQLKTGILKDSDDLQKNITTGYVNFVAKGVTQDVVITTATEATTFKFVRGLLKQVDTVPVTPPPTVP